MCEVSEWAFKKGVVGQKCFFLPGVHHMYIRCMKIIGDCFARREGGSPSWVECVFHPRVRGTYMGRLKSEWGFIQRRGWSTLRMSFIQGLRTFIFTVSSAILRNDQIWVWILARPGLMTLTIKIWRVSQVEVFREGGLPERVLCMLFHQEVNGIYMEI